jgi:hypothetical protein
MRRTARISPVMVRVCFMLGSEPVKVFAAEPADDDRIIVSVKARKLVVHAFSTVRARGNALGSDCLQVMRGRIPRARWCVCALLLHSDANMMCCVLSVKIKMHGGANFFSGPLLAALGFVGAKRLGDPPMGKLD